MIQRSEEMPAPLQDYDAGDIVILIYGDGKKRAVFLFWRFSSGCARARDALGLGGASFRYFKSEKEALYVDPVSAKRRYRFNYLKTRWRTANDFAGR